MIPNFIRRPEYLKALRDNLVPESPPRRKVLVLHGLGGIGKTQLAIRFVRDCQDEFSSIFFLDGSSRASLLKATDGGRTATRLSDAQLLKLPKSKLIFA